MTRALAAVAALTLALASQPAFAAEQALDGAHMSLPWALPFAGILLAIATGPLLLPHTSGSITTASSRCS